MKLIKSLFYSLAVYIMFSNFVLGQNANEINTNFKTAVFQAQLYDPFIGRIQEMYSVIDNENRTHIVWIKDNGNSRVIMYSIYDNNTLVNYVVDADSTFDKEKKHPVMVLDENEKPHIAWFVKRDPEVECCPSGNFAVMYAGDPDGNGIFDVSQVSTNPQNPNDNTATKYTDSYVNNMPSIMINESGQVEVAYISDTYSSISYDSYLVIATKYGTSWTYNEAFILDDINVYTQDGVLFPEFVSSDYYGIIKDISPDDIELVTYSGGQWTRTSLTNNPKHEVEHIQILQDNMEKHHIFYHYRDSEQKKIFVKHLMMNGISVAEEETFELDIYSTTNYVYAAIDPSTNKIFFSYTAYDKGYNEYFVYFMDGAKYEVKIGGIGYNMGYRLFNVRNGFVSMVTGDEDKDSIYVTTNNASQINNPHADFSGTYNGSIFLLGFEIGNFTLEVNGEQVTGTFFGDEGNTNFQGTINSSGIINISISFDDGTTTTVNAVINGANLSGTWSNTDGESGTVSGTKTGSTDINEPGVVPLDFALLQNYPNPFNPGTQISYNILEDTYVTLEVFDLLGRKLATLVNEQKAAGSHSVYFDASELSSGTYIYCLKAGSFVQSRKMVFIK